MPGACPGDQAVMEIGRIGCPRWARDVQKLLPLGSRAILLAEVARNRATTQAGAAVLACEVLPLDNRWLPA